MYKISLPLKTEYVQVKKSLREKNLYTVCEEAQCPNLSECWSTGTATMMILGDTCTRGCRFCHIKSSKEGLPVNPHEPELVAQTVQELNLKYVVITSVDRDDLIDQGSEHFSKVIQVVKKTCPQTKIEVLIPDFQGQEHLMHQLASSEPFVIAQNIEVVKSLTRYVRDRRASYEQTLKCLEFYKKFYPKIYTKTSLMLGLGENLDEIHETLFDLKKIKVDIITFGQYLQPSSKQLPVKKFYSQEEFQEIKNFAQNLGFKFVVSGPLVRSSYRASDFLHVLS